MGFGIRVGERKWTRPWEVDQCEHVLEFVQLAGPGLLVDISFALQLTSALGANDWRAHNYNAIWRADQEP